MRLISFSRTRQQAAIALIVGKRFASAFVTVPRNSLTAFAPLNVGPGMEPLIASRCRATLFSLGNGVRCVHDRPKHSAALYAGRFNIFTSQLGGAIKTRRPSFVSPRMMSSMSGATGIEEICRAAHILCADEEAANAALERIKTGENFGQIASEVSSCPSKEKGGDLGWFKKGQMVAEFEAACFENDPGTIVKVQTQFGWHVVALLSRAIMPRQISVEELSDMMKLAGGEGEAAEGGFQFVDVREEDELQKAKIDGFINLPLSQIEEWSQKIAEGDALLDPEKNVVVMCHHGMRSNQMAQHLSTKLGFKKVYNVEGGIHAYATRVDSSVGVY